MKDTQRTPAQPHQMARSLIAMFQLKTAALDLKSVLAEMQQSHRSLAPFDLTQLVIVPEQLSVIPQIMFPKPRTSRLFAHLSEFPEEVHLVVDAFRTGRDSLFYCLLTADTQAPARWLQRMGQPTLLLNHAEGDLLLAAPAHAFIA